VCLVGGHLERLLLMLHPVEILQPVQAEVRLVALAQVSLDRVALKQDHLVANLAPAQKLRLGFHSCCGTGTRTARTFCLSGTGTGIHSGSSSGYRSGSDIKME